MIRLILTVTMLIVSCASCTVNPTALVPPASPRLTVGVAPTAHPTNLTSVTPPPAETRPVAIDAMATPGRAPDLELYESALRPEWVGRFDLDALTQYRLTLTLPDDLSRLTGTAAVRLVNREAVPLDEVYFHLFPNLWDGGLEVGRVEVNGEPAVVELASGDDLLRVGLSEPIAPTEDVTITVHYQIPIPAGEGVGNYGEFAYQGGVLALAHAYPTVVVYDDDWHLEAPSSQGDVIYADASLYDVSLTAPADLVVAATGVTLAKQDLGNASVTWRLAGGPMRDFNVVASREYISATVSVGDIKINSYALAANRQGSEKALAWAAKALETFESAFGSYPYRELDIVATSTTAGGIEYPGMVVIAADLYSDPQRQEFFESALAHEVAHQWFYNVVGNDQVNEPWLDEALAQYATYVYYGAAYGQSGADGFQASLRQRWSRTNYAPMAIGLPVEAYEGREYGSIVYGRGPLFFLALRDQIGEAALGALLRRYYDTYSWGIANGKGFQSLAEEVSGKNLSALFAEWVYP